jgi:hypothetical protein
MNPPAAFISQNIERFGLLGANNVVPDEEEREPLPPCTCEFTKGNHFRFGFDGREFNRRKFPAAKYWAEYGRPSRPHDGFLAEFTRAMSEIEDLYGPVSVSNSGNGLGRTVIAAAKDLGMSIEQITVGITGYPTPPHDEAIPNRHYQITWDEFAEFAVEFCHVAGCSEPWIALEAYHGHVSDRPHIYPVTALSLLSFGRKTSFIHNNSLSDEDIVGPPNWSYIDLEPITAINRWLLACGRKGIAQILRWSPELIAAQFDAEAFRSWLRQASNPPPPSVDAAEWRAKLGSMRSVVQEAYPNLDMRSRSLATSEDPELNGKIQELQRRLRRANPGCLGWQCYPLHRFIERLGIRFDFDFGQTEDTYGYVRT